MRQRTKILSLNDRLCEYGSLLHYGRSEDTKSQQRIRMEKLMNTAIKYELTERQRVCIRCYYCDEMKVEDIASLLGIRPTTVYKHIRLGRKAIRKCVVYL